jgi:hypothetical protein
MTAPANNTNQKDSVRSIHRDSRISPSLPTPLPLKDAALYSSCYRKTRRQAPVFQPSPIMSDAEMALLLKSALDLSHDVDDAYWADCSDEQLVASATW